jgi:hypothetical protein
MEIMKKFWSLLKEFMSNVNLKKLKEIIKNKKDFTLLKKFCI